MVEYRGFNFAGEVRYLVIPAWYQGRSLEPLHPCAGLRCSALRATSPAIPIAFDMNCPILSIMLRFI